MRSIYATAAACKAVGGASIPPYQRATIVELGQASLGVTTYGRGEFIFDPASSAADALEQMVLTPASGTGRWLRADNWFDLKVPIGFALLNNATLVTVPVGFRFALIRPLYEITADFTGGVASSVGVSASLIPFSTAGDILGGAAGDVAAGLTAGVRGTLGTALAAQLAAGQPFMLAAGGDLSWDVIVSQFTAGAGFMHVPVQSMAL